MSYMRAALCVLPMQVTAGNKPLHRLCCPAAPHHAYDAWMSRAQTKHVFKPHRGLPDVPVQLTAGDEGSHRVDDHDVDASAAGQVCCHIQSLISAAGLAELEQVQLHSHFLPNHSMSATWAVRALCGAWCV